MGARDPDTVSPPPSPMQAVTVAEMRARRWLVTAVCGHCRIRLHVDLTAMIALKGPDFILWGRSGRCRVWAYNVDDRCPGRVVFEARSVQGGSMRALKMTGEVRDAIDLRNQAGQRRG